MRGMNPLRGVNIDSTLGKFLLWVTARRIDFGRLKRDVSYVPVEKVVCKAGGLVRRPLYFVGAKADRQGMVKALEAHKELYRNGILGSPSIPAILFMTFGLGLLPLGNLMVELVFEIASQLKS